MRRVDSAGPIRNNRMMYLQFYKLTCICRFCPKGHDEVNITIEIKADDTPEVAEIFTVNLVNVSGMDRLQTGAVSILNLIESAMNNYC